MNRALTDPKLFRGLIASIVFFAAWEWLGRSELVFGIESFSQTIDALWHELLAGELIAATGATLVIAAVGYSTAVVIGIALGVLTGVSAMAAKVLDPLIHAAYATPMAMFIPVIGIYAGLGLVGKSFLVFTFCVFPISLNTTAGVRQVSRDHYALAAVFRLPRSQFYRKIVLPSASPLVFAGLRISVGRAISGAIAADLLLSVDNLGAYLVEVASRFELDKLLAASFFTAVLGMLSMAIARVIERRALRWNFLGETRRVRQTGFGRLRG
jgi:ABC-type nitrate/sulfonate/bicarbonate transport system permease component